MKQRSELDDHCDELMRLSAEFAKLTRTMLPARLELLKKGGVPTNATEDDQKIPGMHRRIVELEGILNTHLC